MTGVWATTPPYTEAKKDRWLRITWAAKHFKIDRDTLFGWAKAGTVAAKLTPAGFWLVSEQSLRKHLFGSIDAGT